VNRFLTFSILLFALAFAGCSDAKSSAASPDSTPEQSPIKTVRVQPQSVEEGIDLAAKVQPDPASVIRIFPPASGRVVSIRVRPGDHVKQGEVVAVLQSSEIATARSEFEKAKIEAERSERAAKRASLLFEHQVTSEKELEDIRAQAASARSEFLRARQRLQLLGVPELGTTDEITVHSPRNGVVLDVSAAPGELSKSLESSSPLVTLADLGTVWVVADLFEKDLVYAKTGAVVNVSFSAYPGETWKGKIDSIPGALDPNTRTLKLRVVLPNRDQRLKPEMFASVHLTSLHRELILVPSTAVVRAGDSSFVFVKSKDGTIQRKQVTVGRSRDGNIEVFSGLTSGDEIVSAGAELLRNEGGE
jgi:cobalt-zinc-cadmium efflux system membrane fusion protein